MSNPHPLPPSKTHPWGKRFSSRPKLPLIGKYKARFAEEWMVDRKAGPAAMRSGHAKDLYNGQNIGMELLRRPEVQAYIRERMQDIFRNLHVTQERIIHEYARIALHDPRRFFDDSGNVKPIGELSEEDAAVIASIEVEEFTNKEGEVIGKKRKLKTWNKLQALKDLATIEGMFEGKGENPLTIVFNATARDENI